jgi:hypothetical protein
MESEENCEQDISVVKDVVPTHPVLTSKDNDILRLTIIEIGNILVNAILAITNESKKL